EPRLRRNIGAIGPALKGHPCPCRSARDRPSRGAPPTCARARHERLDGACVKIEVRLWAVLGVLWLGGVAAGLAWLAGYANRPGASGRAPETWPAESRVERAADRPTLLLFLHPRCSCSQATLAEFAELLARASAPLTAHVLFVRPSAVAE